MESLIWRLVSPQGRSNMRKVFHGTDLEVFGRERFAARFAGFTKGGVFHLCLAQWVTGHDDYERMFASKNIRDFKSKEEFTRMEKPEGEVLPAETSVATETWAELKLQRDELLAEIETVKKELVRFKGSSQPKKSPRKR